MPHANHADEARPVMFIVSAMRYTARSSRNVEFSVFDYLRFFRTYAGALGFGAGMTLVSSYGQTFMTSLFLPYLAAELSLSNSMLGALFSSATLISALILMKVGKRVDTEALDRYTIKAESILFAAMLILASSFNAAVLFVALFGLRFAGQGLASNIGQTVMARHFEKSRGKALSFASLGYSAGELFVPPAVALLVRRIDWRLTLIALAFLSLAFVLVLLKALPVRSYERTAPGDRFDKAAVRSAFPTKFNALTDRTFWLIAAPGWVFTFGTASYFFYQMLIVTKKGWDPAWYAVAFGTYAVTRIAATFSFGFLIDRFGARFLYPLHFVPFVTGCAVMGLLGTPAALTFFLVALGLTLGFSSVIQSAVLAETYGGEIVGAVRSTFTSVMILASALGPAAYGFALDAGVTIEVILLVVGTLAALAVLVGMPTWKPPRKGEKGVPNDDRTPV